MRQVQMMARNGDRTVTIGDVWEYDPKGWKKQHDRLRREYADHTTTVQIVVGIGAVLFFLLCAAVYIKTGGIR